MSARMTLAPERGPPVEYLVPLVYMRESRSVGEKARHCTVGQTMREATADCSHTPSAQSRCSLTAGPVAAGAAAAPHQQPSCSPPRKQRTTRAKTFPVKIVAHSCRCRRKKRLRVGGWAGGGRSTPELILTSLFANTEVCTRPFSPHWFSPASAGRSGLK